MTEENVLLRDQAIKLRKEGLTLTEITKIISIPKGTIGHWVRGIKMSQASQQRFHQTKKDNAVKSQKMATLAMQEKWKKEREKLFNEGRAFIKSFTVIPTDVASALSLYWAEGNKKCSLTIANSDPNVLLIFQNFLLNHMHLPRSTLRVRVCFYDNIKTESEVKGYWSNLLDLPESQFYKSQINNKPQEKAGKKIGRLKYGVCSLGHPSTHKLYLLQGMLEEFKDRLLGNQKQVFHIGK